MSILDSLIKDCPVRKSARQKESFRGFITDTLAKKNIEARVERTKNGKNDNIVIGNPEGAKAIFTAHYDTPCASLFPNIMIPRNLLLFWLYQFLPLIALVGISLLGGYLVGISVLGSYEAFLVCFLALYYSGYFLGFRTFENKNNANDNTSGVATVMSIIERLDDATLGSTAFILFDNEEKGKKGSKAYFADHADFMKDKLLINFDCVGVGEHIVFIAKPEAEAREEYRALYESFNDDGKYTVHFYGTRGSESNSDYKSFPLGVGCMACKSTKGGLLYTPDIHTSRDITASNDNINYIADGVCEFIRRI